MSKATKRKHVTKEVLEDYILPEGDQQIMRVLASRGNNLHEIETPNGQKFLASMPTKFRKNVWIKRGDFVITIPIEEGDKVKAEIYTILYPDQIKYIKQEGLWPKEFDNDKKTEPQGMIPSDMLPPSDDDSDAENDPDLVVNANRPNIQYYESSDDSSDDDDDEGDEEEAEGDVDNNKTVKDVNNMNGN